MEVEPIVARIERAWMHVIPRESVQLNQRLGSEAGVEIPRRTYAVLLHLREWGPTQVSVLAAASGVDDSTMSRILRQLERIGLVTRERGEDQRHVRAILTDDGSAGLDRIQLSRQRAVAELLLDWDDRDKEQFARLLERYGAAIAQYARVMTLPDETAPPPVRRRAGRSAPVRR